MRKLFGTDGVRGIANRYPMTAEMMLKVGKATAYLFKGDSEQPRVIIGKDTRVSCDMIESAIASGVCSMGVNVSLAGVIPTPAISYLTRSMKFDAGIMISASHNPFQDNGVKIFASDGFKLPDKKELEIEGHIFSDNLNAQDISPYRLGRVISIEDGGERYVKFLKGIFPCRYSMDGMRIVMDCANGAVYRVAPLIFKSLDAEIVSLFDEPNGNNINLNCGSLHPEILAEEVVKRKADAGFAFDGDGDRVIAVDERGNIITGDQIMAVCAISLKKEGRLRNNLVVSTVMSNKGLGQVLEENGIEQINVRVGDRYVLEKMQATGAIIGGEDSGHLIFLEHHTTGDGILTALQTVGVMKKEQKGLSELASVMKVFPQILMNVDVKEKPDISTLPDIMDVIREVEMQLGEKGRVLVRYSGTQTLCRVMVEGPNQEETQIYCKKIVDSISKRLG